MSVELDPPELGFRRPFTHEVSQVLKLTNTNSEYVAFKVKTTAPKQYCVRPNSGHIEPGQSVEVQVLLQAMREEPPLDARCRDKFLVQSVIIDAAQAADANVWNNLDKVAKDSIKEKKIRVTFLPAHGEGATTNGTETAPPAYVASPPTPISAAQSPTGAAPSTARDFTTPSKTSDSPYTQAGLSAIAAGSKSTSSDATTSGASTVNEKAANLYNSAAASISNAASATGETLQQQLDNAKDTIVQLKEQIGAQNLRQRKTDASSRDVTSSSGSSNLGVQQHTSSDGVPVQIVAGLCLLSFLVAYFFF